MKTPDFHQRLLSVSLAVGLTILGAPAHAAGPVVERSAKAGTGLYELVFNAGDGKVYVAATGDWDRRTMTTQGASIQVIDPASLTVTRRLPLGDHPLFGLGLNSRSQILYGSNTVGGSVTALDLTSGQVLATIRDPSQPGAHVRDVAVDERTNRVYVSVVGGFATGQGQDVPQSAVWVIDGNTNTLTDTIRDPVRTAVGLAIDPGANRLYVADMAQNQIAVIDLATHQPLAYYRAYDETAVEIAPSPFTGRRENGAQNIAVDTQGKRLFVTNPGSGTLTVLDAGTGRILATVKTGAAPLDVAWNAGAGQIYVTNRGNGDDGTVTVLDGASYRIVAQLKTGTYPQTLSVDPASHAVFVSNKARERAHDAKADAAAPDDSNGDTVSVIRP